MSLKVKSTIIIFIVIACAVLVFAGVDNHKKKQIKEDRLEQLIAEAEERRKQNQDKAIEELPDNLEEFDRGTEDLNIDGMFNREDAITQATYILGIINNESRLRAMEFLPLTEQASKRYFGNADNIFYGVYNDKVSIDVLFAGMGYESSPTSYSANVLSNVTKYAGNGETREETISLVINYEGTKISSWEY